MRIVVPVEPMGKPRMTRADAWKKRERVLRYWAFANELRLRVGRVIQNPSLVSWKAFFPMPKSWPKKKKLAMAGSIHQEKPDRDNVDKAILDALFEQDKGISGGTIMKFWDDGRGPRIELEIE